MTRVLVVGAAGQLGSAVAQAFAGSADVVTHTRKTLDVTDPEAVRRAVADARPSVVVNCTAYNDVDGAEDRASLAFAVNTLAVRSLARAAGEQQAVFVHYSTDFVFDGSASEAYTEQDRPVPRSTYAMSKLTGEWFALEQPRGYVLRVESLFGMPAGWQGRRGTLDSIVAGLEEGRVVKVFTDRVVSPSYVRDVADATRFVAAGGCVPGLYHCVNGGQATWHDVAVETARMLGITPRLEPVTMEQMALKAPRPRFCALNNGKLAAAGYRMPSWQDAVARWIAVRGRAEAGKVPGAGK